MKIKSLNRSGCGRGGPLILFTFFPHGFFRCLSRCAGIRWLCGIIPPGDQFSWRVNAFNSTQISPYTNTAAGAVLIRERAAISGFSKAEGATR